MKRIYRSAGFAAALIVGSSVSLLSGAQASEIVLGSSGNNNVTFTSGGVTGFMGVSIAASSPTGVATFSGDTPGTYSLGADAFVAGPYNSGVFPVGPNTESFSFLGGDGDALTGTITWNSINDNSIVNTFVGTLTVATLSGDAAFLAAFASLTAEIDFTTNALSTTLIALSSQEAGTQFTTSISSGEVAPTPIPGTLPLLATGLAGLWALRRKRKVAGLESAA